MWHEARKQERKIRGMIVDYRKRAERRQDFYEKIVSNSDVVKKVWILLVFISRQKNDKFLWQLLIGCNSGALFSAALHSLNLN